MNINQFFCLFQFLRNVIITRYKIGSHHLYNDTTKEQTFSKNLYITLLDKKNVGDSILGTPLIACALQISTFW